MGRTSSRMRPRQLADKPAERVATYLEIGELVVGGAGRRQQHHRIPDMLAARLVGSRRQGGR